MLKSTIDNLDKPYVFGDLTSINNIWLTLTNKCNIHCKYCFNYIYRQHEDMPPDLAVSILKIHRHSLMPPENKNMHILYFGGEPTINQSAMIRTIEYINANPTIHTQIDVLTNGIINPKCLTELLKYDLIYQISLDGRNNNLRYFKNSIKNADEQTIQCIKKISQHGAPIKIRATIHHDNVTNMLDLITFCHHHDIRFISFAPICMFGDSLTNSLKQPTIDDYICNMHQAITLAEKYNINIELKGEQYFNMLSKNKMKIPFVWLPDGKVAMSITYASSRIPGSDSIMIGEYLSQSDQILLDKNKIHEMESNFSKNRKRYCVNCPLLAKCRGIIHFTPFATNTFIEERDRYFCHLAIEMDKAFPA